MRTTMLVLAAAAALAAGCGGSSGKSPAPEAGGLDGALEACARGDLDAAEAMVRSRTDGDSLRLRARILMMKNRNREALEILLPLAPQRGQKVKTYEMMERQNLVLPDLALAYVRQDDFQNASHISALMGEAILAKKYETLARTIAYSSSLGSDEIAVEFVAADPVPVISGTVNGRRVLFVIDTLMDEILLDRGFARRAGIEAVGLRGGGAFDEATASEIGLGRATIRNVPVHIGEASDLGQLRPDGVVGLQFLMHFDFTLDYRRSRLILRKAGGTLAAGQPAFIAGDRYLLTRGMLNGKDPMFIGVGSGLRGVTLAASEYYLSQGVEVASVSAGGIRLVKPALDSKAFPAGLEGAFGIPIGFVLGHAALRGHVLRLEPYSMRMVIE